MKLSTCLLNSLFVFILFVCTHGDVNDRLRKAQDELESTENTESDIDVTNSANNNENGVHINRKPRGGIHTHQNEYDDTDFIDHPDLMPPPMRFKLAEDIDFSSPTLELVECFLLDNVIFIQVRRDWSPLGAERFIELVKDKYYDGTALFRAIDGFLIQFGLSANEELRNKWKEIGNIKDDPKQSNVKFSKGIMSFAGSNENSRNTQVFFTLLDGNDIIKSRLGREPWETPFAKVIGHVELLDSVNTQYGDDVSQRDIWKLGYEYLRTEFPNLTYIDQCRMVSDMDINSIKSIRAKMEEHEEL